MQGVSRKGLKLLKDGLTRNHQDNNTPLVLLISVLKLHRFIFWPIWTKIVVFHVNPGSMDWSQLCCLKYTAKWKQKSEHVHINIKQRGTFAIHKETFFFACHYIMTMVDCNYDFQRGCHSLQTLFAILESRLFIWNHYFFLVWIKHLK